LPSGPAGRRRQLSVVGSYTAPPTGPSGEFEAHTTIPSPVHTTAAPPSTPGEDGAIVRQVRAVELYAAPSYPLSIFPLRAVPPQMIISVPVQTADGPRRPTIGASGSGCQDAAGRVSSPAFVARPTRTPTTAAATETMTTAMTTCQTRTRFPVLCGTGRARFGDDVGSANRTPSQRYIEDYAENLADLNVQFQRLLTSSEHASQRKRYDAAIDAILKQQEPFPAVVMNRHWDIVATNRAAIGFFRLLLDGRAPPAADNVLRLMFHPEGLRPAVENWDDVAQALIRRVHREALGGALDAAGQQLLAEILDYPGVPRRWRTPDLGTPLVPVVPVSFHRGPQVFHYFSTVTVLGTPQDVTLQELRVECFFPLDDETAEAARSLASRPIPAM